MPSNAPVNSLGAFLAGLAVCSVVLPLAVAATPFFIVGGIYTAVKDRRKEKAARKLAMTQKQERMEKKAAQKQEKFLNACRLFNTFREKGKLDFMTEEDIPESMKFLLYCRSLSDLIEAAEQVRDEVLDFADTYYRRDQKYAGLCMDGLCHYPPPDGYTC